MADPSPDPSRASPAPPTAANVPEDSLEDAVRALIQVLPSSLHYCLDTCMGSHKHKKGEEEITVSLVCLLEDMHEEFFEALYVKTKNGQGWQIAEGKRAPVSLGKLTNPYGNNPRRSTPLPPLLKSASVECLRNGSAAPTCKHSYLLGQEACGFQGTFRYHANGVASLTFNLAAHARHSPACQALGVKDLPLPATFIERVCAMGKLGLPPKVVYQQLIVEKMLQEAKLGRRVPLVYNESQITEIFRHRGIGEHARRDSDDMAAMVAISKELIQDHNMLIIYKNVNQAYNSPEVEMLGLMPPQFVQALESLSVSDFFLLVIPRWASALMREAGSLFHLDSTAAFTVYNSMKMMPFLFNYQGETYPGPILFTLSERAEVIVAALRCMRVAVPFWSPLALMSDLAPSAYNALTEVFGPVVAWLWCMYHQKKALREMLLQLLQRPDGWSIEEYKLSSKRLYQAIMTLFGEKAGKDGFRPHRFTTEGEFERAMSQTRLACLALGQHEVLRYLDVYHFPHYKKWAMYVRVARARALLPNLVAEEVRNGVLYVKIPHQFVVNTASEAFNRLFKVTVAGRRTNQRMERVLGYVLEIYIRSEVKAIAKGDFGVCRADAQAGAGRVDVAGQGRMDAQSAGEPLAAIAAVKATFEEDVTEEPIVECDVDNAGLSGDSVSEESSSSGSESDEDEELTRANALVEIGRARFEGLQAMALALADDFGELSEDFDACALGADATTLVFRAKLDEVARGIKELRLLAANPTTTPPLNANVPYHVNKRVGITQAAQMAQRGLKGPAIADSAALRAVVYPPLVTTTTTAAAHVGPAYKKKRHRGPNALAQAAAGEMRDVLEWMDNVVDKGEATGEIARAQTAHTTQLDQERVFPLFCMQLRGRSNAELREAAQVFGSRLARKKDALIQGLVCALTRRLDEMLCGVPRGFNDADIIEFACAVRDGECFAEKDWILIVDAGDKTMGTAPKVKGLCIAAGDRLAKTPPVPVVISRDDLTLLVPCAKHPLRLKL